MMKTILKLALLGCIFIHTSCKKKKTENAPEQPPVTPVEIKTLLPVKLESKNLVIQLKYQANTALLVEISDSDGYLTTVTYKNDQPYQIQKAKNGTEFQLVDFVKTKDNEPKARSFDYSGKVYTPTGSYIFTYDPQEKLQKIRYYSDAGALLKERVFQYESGNISKFTDLEKEVISGQRSFNYDSSNGIFAKLKYPERLFPELKYAFFNFGSQNVLSSASSGMPEISYSYTYNADGYPSQLTFTQNKKSETFKISYTELKT